MALSQLALALAFLAPLASKAVAQEPASIPLWPNGAPGSAGKPAEELVRLTPQGEHIVSRVHRPSIIPYLPDTALATGAAVIIIPGGGHRELWMDHEGYRVGRWLSDHGIAAFVLKYRLAREEGSTYTVERDALADVERAIRTVRVRASEYGVAPDRIGVMGFSAGGELAALAGVRHDQGAPAAADPVDRASSHPAFMGLIYPSIPADLPLSKTTAPAFLLSGENDSPAIADGVAQLYQAIRHAGGSAELHVLTGAGHGFGIRDTNPRAIAAWPSLFLDWLDARGIVGSRSIASQITTFMRDGIPGAKPVPVYSVVERVTAAQRALRLDTPPILGPAMSLTPDSPSGRNGSHLSFWKPSFVLGTPSGGEAGINFWGIHNEGHVNVGFTPVAAGTFLLDCRILSAGEITWKIYPGARESLNEQGRAALTDNHLLLLVPVSAPGEVISVELWPTPVTEMMGFLGCDLSAATGLGR